MAIKKLSPDDPVNICCGTSIYGGTYIGLNAYRISDGTNIVCSEPVKWVTEYRIPVINKIPRDYCNYFGNPDIQVDKSAVQNMIDDWTDSPKAYCLDVGVLDTGETALIEINDAFSCGSYSMSAETYGDLLTTRWNELKG